MVDLTPELLLCIVKIWLTYTAMLRNTLSAVPVTTLETIHNNA